MLLEIVILKKTQYERLARVPWICPFQEMNTLSYYCALVALVPDYLDVTSYELALVSVAHSAMTAQ